MNSQQKSQSQQLEHFDLTTNEFILFTVNLSVNDSSVSLAISIINSYTKEVSLAHIIDNNFLTALENVISKNKPAHEDTNYYLLANTPLTIYDQKIKDIVDKLPQSSSFQQKSININHKIFNEKICDLWQGLKILLQESTFENSQITFNGEEHVLPLEALYHTITYTKIMQFESFFNAFQLKKLSIDSLMSFDLNTVNCLNIFDNNEEKKLFLKSSAVQNLAKNAFNSTFTKTKTSIFSVLNNCQTKFGARILRVWLMQPLQSKEIIDTRLNIVEALLSQISFNTEMRNNYLSHIDDLQTISIKISRYMNNPQGSNCIKLSDCSKLQRIISTSKGLYGYIRNYEGVNQELFHSRYIDKLKDITECLSNLEKMFSETILYDNEQRDYMVHPSLNPKMMEIKKKIDSDWKEIKNIKEEIEDEIKTRCKQTKGAKKNTKVNIVQYITGSVFELPKAQGDELINNNKSNYKLVNTNKRTIMISTPESSQLSSEIKDLKIEYHQVELESLKEIFQVVASYLPVINNLINIIAEIDILSSFALMVSNSTEPYTKPIINNSRRLILKNSRHLLLEWNSSLLKNSTRVISNDCDLNETINIKVITGINMGGKSTYLRQVAICALLAHIGCYVPASYAEIPIIDQLFTRVGAGDLMLKGISTYMNEMIEVCSLIKSATKNSLLLIDELGRGTSTDDGVGISWAILYHISKEINAYCLFATHFYELTEMEKELSNVKNYYTNYSMALGELVLEYKVIPGKNNKSFGVGMFHSMKFDEKTCDTLNKFIEEEDNKGDDVIMKNALDHI